MDAFITELLNLDPAMLGLDELEQQAIELERQNQCASSVAKEIAAERRFENFVALHNLKLDLASCLPKELARFLRYFYATSSNLCLSEILCLICCQGN
ncbi:hypothetical protein BOX15_Mlig021408g1 [Macrostomum lignano]|uniref:Uncharacterized protein n=1 Tax=Macrostomum lignano TaxID=282301 RepID=A0A267FKE3_9PLAT|nr:hypothetical protein BOX15_Mlig021408g1 [Macrostomum lignano]